MMGSFAGYIRLSWQLWSFGIGKPSVLSLLIFMVWVERSAAILTVPSLYVNSSLVLLSVYFDVVLYIQCFGYNIARVVSSMVLLVWCSVYPLCLDGLLVF